MVVPISSRAAAVALSRLISGLADAPAAQLVGLVSDEQICGARSIQNKDENSDFRHIPRRFDVAVRPFPGLPIGEKIEFEKRQRPLHFTHCPAYVTNVRFLSSMRVCVSTEETAFVFKLLPSPGK